MRIRKLPRVDWKIAKHSVSTTPKFLHCSKKIAQALPRFMQKVVALLKAGGNFELTKATARNFKQLAAPLGPA